MASQDQISDEIYAQQLQDEEDREAARLQSQRMNNSQTASSPMIMQPGQAVYVKLHHVMTNRQVGEILIANYITSNVMTFELANRRGYRMRIKGYGAVEFSPKNDSKCQFYVEAIPTGGMFLKPMAYAQNRNDTLGVGWYLSMSHDGILTGQGGRTQMAQWVLVAAKPNSPPAGAVIWQQQQQQQQHPVQQNTPQHHAQPAPATTATPSGGGFSGLFGRTSSNTPRESEEWESRNPLLGESTRESATDGVELRSVVSGSANTRSGDNNQATTSLQSTDYDSDSVASAAYGAIAAGQLTAASAGGVSSNAPPVFNPAISHVSGIPPPAPVPAPKRAELQFPGYDANRDALVQFFSTPEGRHFLNSSPKLAAASQLMAYGVLKTILHRPDWADVANRYRDLSSVAESKPYPPPTTDEAARVGSLMNVERVQSFLENGYVIVPGAVSADLVSNALRLCTFWLTRAATSSVITPQNSVAQTLRRRARGRVQLIGGIAEDPDILSLYYQSDLIYVAQVLLGTVVHPVTAESVTATPDLDIMGMEAHSMHQSSKWVIEGFDGSGNHSPFNLLIGVALTDMMMPDMGNFCVHEMSHMILMDEYKQQVEKKSTLFSENPDIYSKPDLTVSPKQLLLHAGDAFLCTQRLAYSFQSNTAASFGTTIVFFRVFHPDNDSMKSASLDDIWLQFGAAQEYVRQNSKLDDESSETRSGIDALSAQAAPVSVPPSSASPAPVSAPVRATCAPVQVAVAAAPVSTTVATSSDTEQAQNFANFDLLDLEEASST